MQREAEDLWSSGQIFDVDDANRFLNDKFDKHRKGEITGADRDRAIIMYKELIRLIQEKGGVTDCISEETCSNVCTGIGAQLAAAQTCNENLLDSLAKAAGRRHFEPEPGVIPPIDIVANYPADYAPVDKGDIPICLMSGSSVPSKPDLACGLMLCTSGGMSQETTGGCLCERELPAFTPMSRLCLLVNCGPDSILGDDCQCHGYGENGTIEDWPRPRPSPEG